MQRRKPPILDERIFEGDDFKQNARTAAFRNFLALVICLYSHGKKQ
jgi:hypothetical protein